jgi:hypothetical protein
MRLPTVRPSGWKVRTRSTVVAAVVVTVGMAVASAAMLLVLYHTLQQSAQQAAEARAVQLVEQLRSDAPADLDPGLLGTDGQVGVIQILNPRRRHRWSRKRCHLVTRRFWATWKSPATTAITG